jgi:hypothetical protein
MVYEVNSSPAVSPSNQKKGFQSTTWGGVAQEADHLASKCKALSSTPVLNPTGSPKGKVTVVGQA